MKKFIETVWYGHCFTYLIWQESHHPVFFCEISWTLDVMSNPFSRLSWSYGPSPGSLDCANLAGKKRFPCHLAPCTVLLARKCSLLIGVWITSLWCIINSQSLSHPQNIRTVKCVWPCGWDQIDSKSVLSSVSQEDLCFFSHSPPRVGFNPRLLPPPTVRSPLTTQLPGCPASHRMNTLLVWGESKMIKRCDG